MGPMDEYELYSNMYETFYGMTLYVGSEGEAIQDVVFDTGSSWLIS